MNDQITILVTGGAGFIGSHTCVSLIGAGYDVIVIDDLSNSRREVMDSISEIAGSSPKFYEGDLTDKRSLKTVFEENRIDAVIHFAAKKLVGESVEQPLDYYYTNLVSLMNLLECCHDKGVRKIVFSSSCTVYGQPDQLPVTENAPVKAAESPYGNTKMIAEDILKDVSRTGSADVVSLRYFNPVGAHESALIGEYPLNKPSNLMPVITQFAIGKLDQLNVYGDDYDTPDGTCIRDYIHVMDVAEAHLKAVEYLGRDDLKGNFHTFNLGTGKGITVLEMLQAFEKVNDQKLDYKISDRRPGDVEKVYASTDKANNELGWKAERTLDDMVRSAWKWEQRLNELEKVGSK